MIIEELAKKLAPHSMLAQVALESPASSWGNSLISYIKTKAAELGLNEESNKTISHVDGEFIVKFPADEDMKIILQRQVEGIRFVKAKNHWHVKASLLNAEAMRHFGDVNGFTFDESAMAAIQAILDTAQENLKGSHVLAAEFRMPADFAIQLRPYQMAGVEYALRVKDCLIADAMGIGKTFQAIATIHAAAAYPCLVIPPASAKINWEKEIRRALPQAQVLVCNSRAHVQYALLFGQYDFYIVNYDLLSAGWDSEDKKNVKLSDLALAIEARGIQGIIADESHYVKSETAQRSHAAWRLAEPCKVRLALTGTPVENRPKDLIGQLKFINRLKDFGSSNKFKKRYCDQKQEIMRGRPVWTANGATNTKELGDILRSTCMIRRKKKDVLTDLPPKQITTIEVELDNRKEYEAAEFDVVQFVRQLALQDQAYRQTLGHLSREEQELAMLAYANTKERKAKRAQQLTKFNVLKKLESKGKMVHVKEWINNFLDEDDEEKLVVFAFYIETQQELKKLYPDFECVLGDMNPTARGKAVERFQTDPKVRGIICSITAAAEAINLFAASHCLTIELPYTASKKEQSEDRLHRSGQTKMVNIWDMIGINSIAVDNYAALAEKKNAADEILEGNWTEDNYLNAITDKLLARYSK